ncbi:MAG TPA: hypothetical protein DCF93_02550 [Desulfuromonas sp.]|nr:hypothetical protein [Desulfuromonas sp.]
MQFTKILLLIAFSLLTLACTKDQIYHSIYEGATTHERLKNPPGPNNDPMSYNQYEIKRKEKDKPPTSPAQPVILPSDPGGPP